MPTDAYRKQIADTWPRPLHPAMAFGVNALWATTTDPDARGRPATVDLGCLQQLAVTGALLALPYHEPVPESALDPSVCARLGRMPTVVLSRRCGDVVRLVRVPLQIDEAVMPARTLVQGMKAAAVFSTYCTRSVVLAPSAQPTSEQLADAARCGVGVYRHHDTVMVEVVAPEPFPKYPETAASWVLAEKLHTQITRQR